MISTPEAAFQSGDAVLSGASFARRGEHLHLQGKTDASLRLLAEGLHRSPDDVAARLVLARVCRESGRDAEARNWLESVLTSDPECPSARHQLAEMLGGMEGAFHLGRLSAQEPWDEDFRAAGRFPHSAPAIAPETAPHAPAPFHSGIEEDEDEPDIDLDSLPHVATVTLAEIYLQQGLKEQAAQIFRQLLERQPGDASVRKRLEEIETSTSEADLRATGGNG